LAAEFFLDGGGEARYRGLSLFMTVHGQYRGNIIARPEWQRGYVERFLPFGCYERAVGRLLEILPTAYKSYRGPIGVDMMISSDVLAGRQAGRTRLHPCVEVNLRQTMGHLALSFAGKAAEPMLLSIDASGNRYELGIKNFE